MKKYPDWVYNYRIKTLQEFKKEYHQYDDSHESWRRKVPRSFVSQMDVIAGKPIKDLIIDDIRIQDLKKSYDNAIFDIVIPGRMFTYEISKANNRS